MSEKLADKDREIKRLKALAEKQGQVKQQRAQSFTNKSTQPLQFPSSGPRKVLGARGEELSISRVNELQSWMEKEVESQFSRNYLQEEIQHQMEQRSRDVRRLQSLRQHSEGEGGSEAVDEEAKAVDEDMRARSRSIAKAQGQLADLGVVVDKRRFAKITDLREAKILLGGMFQKLSYDKLMEQRSMEGRISAQEEEIKSLREAVQRMEGQGGGGHRRVKSVTAEPVLGHAESGEAVKKAPKVHLKPALPSFTKKTASFTTKSVEEADEDEDSDFDIDESFMEDDEEGDEDYVPESEKKVQSKKRSSKELDGEGGGRKRSKGSDASSSSCSSRGSSSKAEDATGPIEPLSRYTVPVLKTFLAQWSLPVSGKTHIKLNLYDITAETTGPNFML